MKYLLNEWRRFLENSENDNDTKTIIGSKEQLVKYILQYPEENKTIHIDSPKGSKKKFGGDPRTMPFDYGEWPDLINPADDMGWDLIIMPGSDKNEPDLKPVGYVAYKEDIVHKVGNDKIILAHNKVSSSDKKTIEDFFSDMESFKDVEWLPAVSKLKRN